MKKRILGSVVAGLFCLMPSFFSRFFNKTEAIAETDFFHRTAPVEPAQSAESPEQDAAIFAEKIKIAASGGQTLAERSLAVAKSFVGTPYQHNTLEINAQEQVVVNLRALDCWTFVENCAAFALLAKAGGSDIEAFKNEIRQLRYWGGTVDGYGSRIHYFTGWILQGEKRGILRDLTQPLGGKPYQKKNCYITRHQAFYPNLADEKVKKDIENAEKRINSHAWFFIPKSKVAMMEKQIREGDIIATTAARGDLDISHQGFAVRQNGRIHFLHASSVSHKVTISARPLAEYLARNKSQSGIMVIRFAD